MGMLTQLPEHPASWQNCIQLCLDAPCTCFQIHSSLSTAPERTKINKDHSLQGIWKKETTVLQQLLLLLWYSSTYFTFLEALELVLLLRGNEHGKDISFACGHFRHENNMRPSKRQDEQACHSTPCLDSTGLLPHIRSHLSAFADPNLLNMQATSCSQTRSV